MHPNKHSSSRTQCLSGERNHKAEAHEHFRDDRASVTHSVQSRKHRAGRFPAKERAAIRAHLAEDQRIRHLRPALARVLRRRNDSRRDYGDRGGLRVRRRVHPLPQAQVQLLRGAARLKDRGPREDDLLTPTIGAAADTPQGAEDSRTNMACRRMRPGLAMKTRMHPRVAAMAEHHSGNLLEAEVAWASRVDRASVEDAFSGHF